MAHTESEETCSLPDCSKTAKTFCRGCKEAFLCLQHSKGYCIICTEKISKIQAERKRIKVQYEQDIKKYQKEHPISNIFFTPYVLTFWVICIFILSFWVIVNTTGFPVGDDGIGGAFYMLILITIFNIPVILCCTSPPQCEAVHNELPEWTGCPLEN